MNLNLRKNWWECTSTEESMSGYLWSIRIFNIIKKWEKAISWSALAAPIAEWIAGTLRKYILRIGRPGPLSPSSRTKLQRTLENQTHLLKHRFPLRRKLKDSNKLSFSDIYTFFIILYDLRILCLFFLQLFECLDQVKSRFHGDVLCKISF